MSFPKCLFVPYRNSYLFVDTVLAQEKGLQNQNINSFDVRDEACKRILPLVNFVGPHGNLLEAPTCHVLYFLCGIAKRGKKNAAVLLDEKMTCF